MITKYAQIIKHGHTTTQTHLEELPQIKISRGRVYFGDDFIAVRPFSMTPFLVKSQTVLDILNDEETVNIQVKGTGSGITLIRTVRFTEWGATVGCFHLTKSDLSNIRAEIKRLQ